MILVIFLFCSMLSFSFLAFVAFVAFIIRPLIVDKLLCQCFGNFSESQKSLQNALRLFAASEAPGRAGPAPNTAPKDSK